MARFLKKARKNSGLPPGTLVFVGEQKMGTPVLRMIDYNAENLLEEKINSIEETRDYKSTDSVTWINIDGIHDPEIVESIGSVFELSSMSLEDIMNTGQRPKLLEYEKYSFVVLKMLRWDDKQEKILSEQLSIIIANKFLLTFQESQGDVFDPVRERIRLGRKRIRSSGSDFLAYSLLSVVIENYIQIIEILGEKIDNLEAELLNQPTKELLLQINRYKQEINYLKKCIRPVREIAATIPKTENSIINKTTLEYWQELQELTLQAVEGIEAYREILADQLNLYHTTMSTKMNDIMKVLTIFSAIFIPLTFIAGIYGTNFDVLPELHFEYSYFIMLGFMGIVVIGMLIFFRKQKWF